MTHTRLLPICLALAALPATAQAQAKFADLASVDRAVEAFTGIPIGAPGGARSPLDRRLKLTECGAPLALSFYGQRRDNVKVECTDARGWRIFVPLAAAPVAQQAEQMVARGDIVSVTVLGRGFSVVQSGEALEAGTLGDWIRVQPPGKSDIVRGRIASPGRVVIPLS